MLLEGKQVEEFIKEKGIKHFKSEEFECKHCGKVIIESKLIEVLEKLRNKLGKPVIITSGYRCEEHNKEIGGVPNSAHVRGYAVDIKAISSKTRYEIVNFLLLEGIKRIGIAGNFIHFDVDPEKPSPRIWVYGKRKHIA